jgi:hypothetical protein
LESKVVTVPTAEETRAVAQQVGEGEASQIVEDLTDKINTAKADADKCLTGGVRSCLPVNYKIGSVGDSLVFAYGVKSQEVPQTKYRIVVNFIEYQTPMGAAPIEAEDATMNTWVVSKHEDKYMASQEKWLAPVVVKIGENVGVGKNTVPGTYVFEIQAQKIDEHGFTDIYETKRISIKAK